MQRAQEGQGCEVRQTVADQFFSCLFTAPLARKPPIAFLLPSKASYIKLILVSKCSRVKELKQAPKFLCVVLDWSACERDPVVRAELSKPHRKLGLVVLDALTLIHHLVSHRCNHTGGITDVCGYHELRLARFQHPGGSCVTPKSPPLTLTPVPTIFPCPKNYTPCTLSFSCITITLQSIFRSVFQSAVVTLSYVVTIT